MTAAWRKVANFLFKVKSLLVIVDGRPGIRGGYGIAEHAQDLGFSAPVSGGHKYLLRLPAILEGLLLLLADSVALQRHCRIRARASNSNSPCLLGCFRSLRNRIFHVLEFAERSPGSYSVRLIRGSLPAGAGKRRSALMLQSIIRSRSLNLCRGQVESVIQIVGEQTE